MSLGDQQVAWANEKGGELAKTGAVKAEAEVAAERNELLKMPLRLGKEVHATLPYAATFHDEVEEVVDVDDVKSARKTKTSPSVFWL